MTESTLSFGSQREGASRYLTALREHWLLIAVLVAVAVGSAALYSYTATKRYEAEATILVTPIGEGDTTFVGMPVIKESNGLTSGVLTAASLIQTPEIAEGIRRHYNFGLSRGALLGAIDVKPLSQSNIIAVQATAGTAARSAAIANAFATELIRQRSNQFQSAVNGAMARLRARLNGLTPAQLATPAATDLQAQLSELTTLSGGRDPTLHLASAAVPPTSPSWPRPLLSIAVAFLVALLIGAGAALALEVFNPRINREDELLLGHRLPILARVPRVRTTSASRYLTHRGKLPPHVWEAYRTLRASLTGAGPKGGFPRRILVTSAIPGEAKTMTSVNLALTMAATGARVILIDADLRRPMIATVFGAAARSNGFGLLLLGNAPPELALLPAPGAPNLQLLLANPRACPPRRPAPAQPPRGRARAAAGVRRRDHHRLAAADRGRRRPPARRRGRHDPRLGSPGPKPPRQARAAAARAGAARRHAGGFVVTSRRVVKRPAYGYEYQSVERQTTEPEEPKVRRQRVEVGPGE